MKETKYDIFCLQDTHFHQDQIKDIYTEWGSNCILSFSSSNSRGVGIFFSSKLDFKINEKVCDDSGNFILIDLNIGETRLSLITLYGPNEDNRSFYENIFNKIDEIRNEDYVETLI